MIKFNHGVFRVYLSVCSYYNNNKTDSGLWTLENNNFLPFPAVGTKIKYRISSGTTGETLIVWLNRGNQAYVNV